METNTNNNEQETTSFEISTAELFLLLQTEGISVLNGSLGPIAPEIAEPIEMQRIREETRRILYQRGIYDANGLNPVIKQIIEIVRFPDVELSLKVNRPQEKIDFDISTLDKRYLDAGLEHSINKTQKLFGLICRKGEHHITVTRFQRILNFTVEFIKDQDYDALGSIVLGIIGEASPADITSISMPLDAADEMGAMFRDDKELEPAQVFGSFGIESEDSEKLTKLLSDTEIQKVSFGVYASSLSTKDSIKVDRPIAITDFSDSGRIIGVPYRVQDGSWWIRWNSGNKKEIVKGVSQMVNNLPVSWFDHRR